METLGRLESFVCSAQAGSFSAASRKLGLSPGAVSKNVARLEESVGALLFHRNTRKLALTEAGERFLREVQGGLVTIQDAIVNLSGSSEASGVLRVSSCFSWGFDHLLPLMPEFMKRYPQVVPDWHFDNGHVDIIAEGYDAAIGGGSELTPGLVARELGNINMVVLASPNYMQGLTPPSRVSDLDGFKGIVMRSNQTGRLRSWELLHPDGQKAVANLTPSVILNDPEALCICAALGLGITIAPIGTALPFLNSGQLVRLLPEWHVDVGSLWIYFQGNRLLPAKTRVFIDFVVEQFKQKGLGTLSALPCRKAPLVLNS